MADTKTKPPYPGPSSEFREQSRRLCQTTIDTVGWRSWHNQQAQEKLFPKNRGWRRKLRFIDAHLYEKLLPENVAPDPDMSLHERADLNKYRGWLLHAVLKHVYESELAGEDKKVKYNLPNDLSVLIEDLYLFHKHAKGEVRNINQYRSLNEFAELVDSFVDYPLSAEEQEELDIMYLEEAPAKSPNFVGGAHLIATLENGTRVISLTTGSAAKAYGSPRWCTAYRHRPTAFHTYTSSVCRLLVLVTPHGNRWQISLANGQWRDAKNKQLDLAVLLHQQPGLKEILEPEITIAIEHVRSHNMGKEATRLIDAFLRIDGWGHHAKKTVSDVLMQLAGVKGEHYLHEILNIAKTSPALKAEVAEHISLAFDTTFETGAEEARRSIEEAGQNVSEWYRSLAGRYERRTRIKAIPHHKGYIPRFY